MENKPEVNDQLVQLVSNLTQESIKQMNQTAEELRKELGLPPEAKYELLRMLFGSESKDSFSTEQLRMERSTEQSQLSAQGGSFTSIPSSLPSAGSSTIGRRGEKTGQEDFSMPLESLDNGHFIVQRKIPGGNMGEIYLCTDTQMKRQVVVKLVRIASQTLTDHPDRQEALENFEHEARILARLRHLHIVPLHNYGQERQEDDLLAYMVMPYYEDGSLETWWKKYREAKPLSVTEVAALLEQAGKAVQFAHDRKIVHRDIKLSNFLVQSPPDPSGLPDLFLADFGIARLIQGTTIQHFGGTPEYAAPELWSNSAVTETDQYALAVMVYYLLTGTYPFNGDMFQLMRQHTSVPSDPPSARVLSHIPPAVDAVILHALEKRPEKRYPTVEAFTKAFRAASEPIVVGQPIDALSETVPATSPRGNTSSLEPVPVTQRGGSTGLPETVPAMPPRGNTGSPESVPATERKTLPIWGMLLIAALTVALLVSLGSSAFLYSHSHQSNTPGVTRSGGLSNIIKTCQSGPDTFHIQEFSNAQVGDQEDIGISDSQQCYVFTSENNTQSPDQAEMTIYSSNQQVPIDKPHITIIVATMLSNYDSSSYSTGRSLLQGAAIAQQEYNLHRGAGKLPLRLLIANSGTNESFASQLAQEIAQLPQKDHSILGVMGWPFSTEQAKEALATLQQAQLSSVSPTLSSTQFAGISPYFFRVVPSDVSQGEVGAAYLLQQHIKYVIVCEDPNNPYSASLAEALKDSFHMRSGGTVPSVVTYQRDTLKEDGAPLGAFESNVQQDIVHDETELGAQPNQIAVYFAGYESDFARFRAYLNTQDTQVLVMGGDGLNEYGAYSSIRGATNFYFTTFADYQMWQNSPKPPCFITQYNASFNPGSQSGGDSNLIEDDAMVAYDATIALLEAYTNARGPAFSIPSLGSMQSQLTQVNFFGVSGPIALSPSGDPNGKPVYIDHYMTGSTTLENPPVLSASQNFPFCQ